ncbi:MAG: nucleotidyltransferase domain-containing protein [Bacteroidetes bacterium]|nr:nucleotidyltransferase domain-containing protein [Bacteroidota bacterium]MBS1541072.1 nucleotidyltransferase domain-containing protein [Bacteroidota bacterium]
MSLHSPFTKKIKNVVHQDYPEAKVILYGSRARGDYKKESDWDILVLLDQATVNFKEEQKIRHKLYPIELETGQSISTFVYSLNDWNTRLSVTPLHRNVIREGIFL